MRQFKYASVPLEHDTVSRKEVAKRLLKAAEIGGYKIDKDPFFSTLHTMDTHFIVRDYGLYSGFYSHSGVFNPEILTLEQFEAHCQDLNKCNRNCQTSKPNNLWKKVLKSIFRQYSQIPQKP